MSFAEEILVCTDCILFIANGDLPDDPQLAAEIVRGVESRAPGHVCAGDADGDVEFSWAACDCCGSRLGGSRHKAVVLA